MKNVAKSAFVRNLGISTVSALALPMTAHAAIIDVLPDDPSRIGKDDVVSVLMQLIQLGLMFASAIGAIFIVVNGYQYIFSAGNPEKIEKAKQGLTWSIGGFVLAVSSYAIVYLVASTLKFNQLDKLRSHQPGSVPSGAPDILHSIANMLFLFGGAIAVTFIILGGYRYVTSQGNQETVEQAKKTILYAVVGLILLFASVLIFNFISDRLGVTNQFK